MTVWGDGGTCFAVVCGSAPRGFGAANSCSLLSFSDTDLIQVAATCSGLVFLGDTFAADERSVKFSVCFYWHLSATTIVISHCA